MILGSASGIALGEMLRLGGILLASACGLGMLGVVARPPGKGQAAGETRSGAIAVNLGEFSAQPPPPPPPSKRRRFETGSDRPWRRRTPMFGILQRYIMGEVFRSFVLALTAITGIFVLFMVMAQAASAMLTPREIMRLVPFVIPASLPYTIPVALLFAVTVVYGRIAADNEVVAVKTAGISALAVLKPAFALGVGLSVLLLFLSGTLIPMANHHSKKVVFENFEDNIYKILKKDRELNNGLPYYIKVADVRDKTLIEPIFKQRVKNPNGGFEPNSYSMVIQAETAQIAFDLDNHRARVTLYGAHIQSDGSSQDIVLINNAFTLDIPFAGENRMILDKKVQEMTTAELVDRYAANQEKIATERQRQTLRTAFAVGSGLLKTVKWGELQRTAIDYQYWEMECNKVETERQMRYALAFGSIFFVMLGAPMGVRAARGDFLSAFIACFVPIIVVYYPLTLFGMNMGKEGVLAPWIALWMGNLLLALLAGLVIQPVLKN